MIKLYFSMVKILAQRLTISAVATVLLITKRERDRERGILAIMW